MLSIDLQAQCVDITIMYLLRILLYSNPNRATAFLPRRHLASQQRRHNNHKRYGETIRRCRYDFASPFNERDKEADSHISVGDSKFHYCSLRCANADFPRGPQPVITINVGPEGEQETFLIGDYTICQHSQFFDAAFNSRKDAGEGDAESMTLEDVDPEVFGTLLHWAYFQKILKREYSTLV